MGARLHGEGAASMEARLEGREGLRGRDGLRGGLRGEEGASRGGRDFEGREGLRGEQSHLENSPRPAPPSVHAQKGGPGRACSTRGFLLDWRILSVAAGRQRRARAEARRPRDVPRMRSRPPGGGPGDGELSTAGVPQRALPRESPSDAAASHGASSVFPGRVVLPGARRRPQDSPAPVSCCFRGENTPACHQQQGGHYPCQGHVPLRGTERASPGTPEATPPSQHRSLKRSPELWGLRWPPTRPSAAQPGPWVM